MSGEAGATLESELYRVFVGKGVIVSVALPPGDDGSAIGKYFASESAPYHRWLGRARADLDAMFAELVAAGEPIVPLAEKSEEIWGVFLEDENEETFRKYYRGGPLAVRLSSRALPHHQSLNVQFLVSTRVEKQRMEAIVARVAALLMKTMDEPVVEEPPLPPPPPPPPSWWARLWRRRVRT